VVAVELGISYPNYGESPIDKIEGTTNEGKMVAITGRSGVGNRLDLGDGDHWGDSDGSPMKCILVISIFVGLVVFWVLSCFIFVMIINGKKEIKADHSVQSAEEIMFRQALQAVKEEGKYLEG